MKGFSRCNISLMYSIQGSEYTPVQYQLDVFSLMNTKVTLERVHQKHSCQCKSSVQQNTSYKNM